MTRILAGLIGLFALVFPQIVHADSGDVDAAARGVVRVVIMGSNGDEVFPVSHGTGFAVSPTMIITNAHVVREALQDDTLRIGIVPSEGDEGAFGKPVAVSPRNDLALIELSDSSLRLPPLTLAGAVSGDMGEVSAVGYPMNVDLAQGLEFSDIFKAQPPVKSRGFLSGERPSRQFDTILHTAPIARGNSGGPLLDGCGRVLGVNSFGADSDGSDAEFYFAVSLRELLPFLRENNVEPRTSALPCRSIDELNAAERARFEQQRAEARELVEAREAELAQKRSEAMIQAQFEVMEERDNAMALAMLLSILAIGGGYFAFNARKNGDASNKVMIAAGVGGTALIGAILVWVTRPAFSEIQERVAAAMEEAETPSPDNPSALAGDGTLLCTFLPERSRVTGSRTDDVEFDWAADGCVNGRTQYGMAGGTWSRVFVPNDEAAVSVNSYNPDTRTFQTDRYLLRRGKMQEAREARSQYKPPSCGVTDAATQLGEQQSAVLGILPDRPNERLVYSCEARAASVGTTGGDE